MPMECLRCGKCCTSFGVCVTIFDVARIAKSAGLEPIAFVTAIAEPPERERTEPAILIDGERSLLVLKWKRGRNCIFYNPKKGCEIYGFRPLLCRTYPFRSCAGRLENTKSRACPKLWLPDDSKQYLADIKIYEKELVEYKKIVDEWNTKPHKTLKDFLEFAILKINIDI